MSEELEWRAECMDEVVDTSGVAPTASEILDVDSRIARGEITIEGSRVLYTDPEIRTRHVHLLDEWPEIDLTTGTVIFHNGLFPTVVTINPGPIAYLRQLTGWSRPTMPHFVKV